MSTKKNGKNNKVWLVRNDSGDVEVFTGAKPIKVKNFYDEPVWRDGPDGDPSLVQFCYPEFRKGTGIRVPKRPVQARVTLIGAK